MIEKEFRIKLWWKIPHFYLPLIMTPIVWGGVGGYLWIRLHVIEPFLFMMMGVVIMYLTISTHCFGVLLTNNELILQNGIWPFWRKKVAYASLEKVICWGQKEKTHPCIVVYKKGYKGFHWYYVIYQVDKKDYAALVEALRTRGVTVEIKGGFVKE